MIITPRYIGPRNVEIVYRKEKIKKCKKTNKKHQTLQNQT